MKVEPVYAEAAEKRKADGNRKGGSNKSGKSWAETAHDLPRALAQAAKETGASLYRSSRIAATWMTIFS